MTTKSTDSASRLTAREYACLHARVPESGTAWLDRIIQAARDLDAEQFKAKVEKKQGPKVEYQGAQTPKSKPQGPKDPPAGGAGTKIG